MMLNPTVSVGLPVYNGDKYITAAIQSILSQEFTNYELIISDNASDDMTSDICQKFAASDERIRYFRQPVNCGVSANFQFVLQESSAPLFMWFAADDICEPNLLQLLVDCHENDPSVVLATSDIVHVDVDGKYLGVSELSEIRPDRSEDWCRQRELFFKNPTSWIFFAIYGLYRRSVLCSLPMRLGSGLRYSTGLEIPFLAQVACIGKIVAAPSAAKQYRWNTSSVFFKERAKMSWWDQLDNHVEISRMLLKVLRNAALPASEKRPLYYTVYYGLTLGTFRKAVGLAMARLGLRGPATWPLQ